MTDNVDAWRPRKLTHEQARLEQRLYWAGKTPVERLAGAAELTRRMNKMRGIDTDELTADIAPRRIRRR